MIVSYGYKRVLRSWKLFLALLLGVILASAFFSGINIGADSMAKRALDEQLVQTPVDLIIQYYSYSSMDGVSFPSSENLTTIVDVTSSVEGVTGVEVNPIVHVNGKTNDEQFYLICAGIFDNSRVYDGMTGWTGDLGINETLVHVDSEFADKLRVGDSLLVNVTVVMFMRDGISDEPVVVLPGLGNADYAEVTFPLDLTVVGFVSLTDEAYTIATGFSSVLYETRMYGDLTQLVNSGKENLCLIGWNTFSKLIDTVYQIAAPSSPFNLRVSVFLNREWLINPWDVAGSLERVTSVSAKINNKVTPLGFYVYDRLSSALMSYQRVAYTLRFGSINTSLPLFFIAWYMASSVSSVSFNLRRREIGLLLSKGSTRGQLLRIFLSEALLIGLIGGAIGVGLSYVLSPLFVELGGGIFGGHVVLGIDTVIMTTIFGAAITLMAIFQPARRAARLNPVDAMREYVYVEEVKPYKRVLPLTALILGTFKIIILALGISLQQVIMNMRLGGNIFLMILLSILLVLDGVLTYIGPLLFFWGFTKVFIQGSLAFQELVTRMMRVLGDLGSLATRNVRRNPGRTASIAFLIALISGYTLSVNGALVSEQDFTVRQVYFNVGSDISVELPSSANVSSTLMRVEAVSGIAATALEYRFYGESSAGTLILKAIDPTMWLDIGYYEAEWFIGERAEAAFQTLAADNNTIILERSLAKYLDLDVGDMITISVSKEEQSIYNLRIIGFFGSEQTQSSSYIPSPYPLTEVYSLDDYWSMYWSYVSQDLVVEMNGTVSASVKLLVKLEPEVNSTAVAEEMRALNPSIGWVSSVEERLELQQSRAELSGIINIQRLGIIFAVVAASIGIGLVTIISLRERRKEISLINIRGASYKQSIITLLSESLAVVVFSLVLGAVVGLIIVHGNIASANALVYSLVKRRILFSLEYLTMLISNYLLVIFGFIIPVIFVNRRYMSKLGDALRQG